MDSPILLAGLFVAGSGLWWALFPASVIKFYTAAGAKFVHYWSVRGVQIFGVVFLILAGMLLILALLQLIRNN
jgi:hypothetical protein